MPSLPKRGFVTEVPFELAEVKLAPPMARSGTVAKEEAITRLCTADVPFATVIAPAGYGKTTLLARWSEADPRPFAWVALDGEHDDAVVFLRYITAAIHRIEPMPLEALDAVSGRGPRAWTTTVPRVGNAVTALQRPLVLVLDDLHAVANPSCLDALAALFEYVPAGSQIAIASREDPALPLGRWRAHGWVHEIGVPDLRLDEQEAGLLLEAAGVELDVDEIVQLTERTEGWPAGLYLAALSMQAGAAHSFGVEVFAGDDRFVSEYFRHELLSRLPAAEVRFLEYTSILDRMNGALCDAVLETTGSAQTLEKLARANGFVVPLDRRGEWYRYHHLFGQLLRDELERGEPDVVPALNRRAMTWCITNDLPEAAVAYGHAAGEKGTVAGLMDALFPSVYYDGRLETLEEWLSWFDDAELARYPELAVYGAWNRALTGRAEDAERWLSLADGSTSTPISDRRAAIEPRVATLRAHMMRDGAERALAEADLALGQLPPDTTFFPVALLARGVAEVLLGMNDRAVESLSETVEQALAAGSIEEVYLAQAELALLAIREGTWDEAGRRARAAQGIVDEAGLGDYSSSALVYVAMARVALHEGRPQDVRTALARAHRLRPMLDHGIPWVTVQVGLEPLASTSHSRKSPQPAQFLRRPSGCSSSARHGRPHRRDANASGARGCNVRAGRGVGDEPHGCGTAIASLPGHASHGAGDRDEAVHLAQHRQDGSRLDLPQAGRLIAQPGDRARRRSGASGELDLPTSRESHPEEMRRGPPPSGRMGGGRKWTNTRSTSVDSPYMRMSSSKRSRWPAARSTHRS